MSKSTGLAAFTRKRDTDQGNAETAAGQQAPAQRTRGKGDSVALTVRLTRAQWERLHQLAVAEGTSIQKLAVDGLSRIFTGKGLPGLN